MVSFKAILVFGFTANPAFGYFQGRRLAELDIRGLQEREATSGLSTRVGSPIQMTSTSIGVLSQSLTTWQEEMMPESSEPVARSTSSTTSNTVVPTTSSTLVVTGTSLTTSIAALPIISMAATTSRTTQLASGQISPFTICTNDTYYPRNISIPRYAGLNVANKIPCGTSGEAPCLFKDFEGWTSTFARIKARFPSANAVRLYSTMDFVGDGAWLHLYQALESIKEYDMKIIVGLWSGGAGDTGRFFAELGALQGALYNHGCENIAAVSVGNGDLETLDSNGSNPDAKRVMVDLLLYQIAMTRNLLRQNGCCDIPVTHTDAWDELGRQDDSGVSKLLAYVDSFVMLNILPYWQQVEGLEGAYGLFRNNSGRVLNTTTLYGKDVWLGETGWPSSDENVTTRNTNNLASPENAKQYFDKIGCQVLLGSGSGFYYVDWDQDAARAGQAQFELLDTEGNALNKIDTTCAGFVAEQNLESWVPKFAGGPAGL